MTDWLEPNPFFGYDYFVEEVGTPYYEYFDTCEDAFKWANEHRPAKVFKFRGAQFYGEKGKSPAVDGSGRDVGNGILVAEVA